MVKLHFAFIIGLTFLSNCLKAQINVDSFKHILLNHTEGCIALDAANQLSTFYSADNQDSTFHYIEIARSLISSCGDEKQRIYPEIAYIAEQYSSWSIDSIQEEYDKILRKKVIENHPQLKAMILTNLARAYSNSGNQKKGVEYSLQALEINERLGNTSEIAKMGYNLGVMYYYSEQYEKAIEKFHIGIVAYQRLNDKVRVGYCINGLANMYINMDVIDSAYYYLEKLKFIADETQNNILQAVSRTGLGTLLADQEDYENAVTNFVEAIPYLKKFGDQLMIANNYCNLAGAKSKLGLFQEGKNYIDLAYSFEILEENSMGDNLCLKIRAVVYKNLKLYDQAIEYLEDYINYQDSVLLLDNKMIISELEEKYEASKKETEIQQQAIEIEKKTYQRNLLILGLITSILIAFSIIWGILSRLKRNKKIAEQEQRLQKQKIKTLEQENKLSSMASLLEGQETERIRIAKELHDGLGGILTNVKAHFGAIQHEIDKLEEIDVYRQANSMIDKAHEEVRRISHNLMPVDLRAGGLQLSVKILSDNLIKIHGIQTDLEMHGMTDLRLDEKKELVAYRIIQELLNNIVKHAHADQVLLQLSKYDDELQILVEDNGVGFDYHEAILNDGLGLKSILSRLEQVGGTIDIKSDQEGSSFSINIPS